jgi:hypothetical protein
MSQWRRYLSLNMGEGLLAGNADRDDDDVTGTVGSPIANHRYGIGDRYSRLQY